MMHPRIHGHDRTTLARIFNHPTSNNLEWREVVAFVERIGNAEEKANGSWSLSLGGREWTFPQPRHKDMDPRDVERLRHLMEGAGLSAHSTEVLTLSEHPTESDALIVVDHHEARIYRLDPEIVGAATETALRPYDPHGHIHHLAHRDGGSDRGQRAPEVVSFYEGIIGCVRDAPRIAIVGHGTGKSSAMSVLSRRLGEHHHETKGRVVATANVDLSAATDVQLLALGREMLSRNAR